MVQYLIAVVDDVREVPVVVWVVGTELAEDLWRTVGTGPEEAVAAADMAPRLNIDHFNRRPRIVTHPPLGTPTP